VLIRSVLGRIAILVAYVDAAYCYRPSSVVYWSVCHSRDPCKNSWTAEDTV